MPETTYNVTCHTCRASFDAMDASWCSCLSKERSLVCPSCLQCFCKAPHSYKQRFWADAPQELWDHKIAEHKRGAGDGENPPVDEVVRPLVLLVDDEAEIRSVAVRAIESFGYGVVVATNGEEGFELAKLYKPELVLSDAMMPKLDGRELAKRIKDDAHLAQTRVVVMTSLYTAAQYKYEALRTFRVDDYVSKPLDFAQLRAVLEKHLSR